jgi:hypothetical protein
VSQMPPAKRRPRRNGVRTTGVWALCEECGEERVIAARGRCHGCYKRLWRGQPQRQPGRYVAYQFGWTAEWCAHLDRLGERAAAGLPLFDE